MFKSDWIPQVLYLIEERKPKENEWFLYETNKASIPCRLNSGTKTFSTKVIIASNIKIHKDIPIIPLSFVEIYNDKISEVIVQLTDNDEIYKRKDNTVVIRKIKTAYTRNEVDKLLRLRFDISNTKNEIIKNKLISEFNDIYY